MINQAQKIDYSAFVSEKYFRHFSDQTFSAESIIMPDPHLVGEMNRQDRNQKEPRSQLIAMPTISVPLSATQNPSGSSWRHSRDWAG